MILVNEKHMLLWSEANSGEKRGDAQGVRVPLIFCNRLFFLCFFFVFVFNHFEELQTVLFEVELIYNNAPLTYVCRNTIEICCLTSNHLLFGRQLLYSSKTT